LTSALFYIPKSVLAAVIVVAFSNIFLQLAAAKDYFQRDRCDFAVWMSTFLGVLVLDVSIGLAVGIAVALVAVAYRYYNPVYVLLGIRAADVASFDQYRTPRPAPKFRYIELGAPVEAEVRDPRDRFASVGNRVSINGRDDASAPLHAQSVLDLGVIRRPLVDLPCCTSDAQYTDLPGVQIFRVLTSRRYPAVVAQLLPMFAKLVHADNKLQAGDPPLPFDSIVLDLSCWSDERFDVELDTDARSAPSRVVRAPPPMLRLHDVSF
jgi:hypothetical protein